MNIDLHCHSSVSDGVFSPEALVARAGANGVHVLALTDHDELAGVGRAQAAAAEAGVRVVPGVEISVTWRETTVHIIGLGVDPDDPRLNAALCAVRSHRSARARRMALEFDAIGIRGTFEGASRLAGNPALIGRAHFARFLVDQGVAKDVAAVFRRYLTPGKPGYVAHRWAELADAVTWIRASGGRAVIAHPGRYRLTSPQLRAMVAEFKDAGGEALEVVTGSHAPGQDRVFAALAQEFGLLASRGSDFHAPGEGPFDIGRAPHLPDGLTPVWHDW